MPTSHPETSMLASGDALVPPLEGQNFSPAWDREQTPLNFKVGPFRLFSARLDLLVTRQILPRPLTTVHDLREPLSREAPVGDGYLLWTHHVTVPPPKMFSLDGLLGYTDFVGEVYIADVTMGPEAYMAHFRGKTRNTLRRKVNKFKEANGGTLDWRIFRTPDEIRQFHCEALPLSVQTYQHNLFGLGLPSSPEFMIHRAAEGDAWGALLYFQGKPAAFMYLEGRGEILYWSCVGYDVALSRLSPGTVLMMRVMDQIQSARRYKFLDFGPGESSFKAMLSTEKVLVASIFVLKNTLRLRGLVMAHRYFHAGQEGLLSFLRWTGVHGWLKRNLRRAAAGGQSALGSPS